MIFGPTGSPCCGGSSEAYMYTLGGETGVSNPNGTVTAYKSAMTSGTTSAVSSANLSANRLLHCGFANPGVAGYSTGGADQIGSTGTVKSSTDKTTFSNDTTASVGTATLSQAREEACAFSERTTKAYVIAGGIFVAGVLTAQKTADVFDYSSETMSGTASAKVATAVKFPCGFFGSTAKGYVFGGLTGNFSSDVVTAYKVTFSGDSTAAQGSANLTVARSQSYAGADGSTKGYVVGAEASGSANTTIDKTIVSTDTTSAITATWTYGTFAGASGSDGTNLLCMSGSFTDPAGRKLTFSSDTLSNFGIGTAGNIGTSALDMAGFSTVAL